MNTEQRIKLAEAMGWTNIRMKYVEMDGQSYPFGCPPAHQYSGGKVDPAIKEQIPDPFTDANDCEALILWLCDSGWWIIVNHHQSKVSGCNLKLGKGIRDPQHDWDGEHWKHGVCELALKALESA